MKLNEMKKKRRKGKRKIYDESHISTKSSYWFRHLVLSSLRQDMIWYGTMYHYQLGDASSFGFWALTRKVFSAWGRRVETCCLLAIFENFTPVSLFWTNNNLLFSRTKFISSKHTCSPTTPVNIRIAYLTVLYLWHHKIGKNRIFW